MTVEAFGKVHEFPKAIIDGNVLGDDRAEQLSVL